MRRIEAVTGPEAVALLRRHDDLLHEAADALRTQPERLPEAVAALRARGARGRQGRRRRRRARTRPRSPRARRRSTARVVLAEVVEAPDAKALMDIADRVKGKLGDSAAIVLGTRGRRPRAPRRRGHAGARRARRQGRRGRQGRRAGRPAAEAAGATRWRRPAAAIPTSSPRRSRPPARPSSTLSASLVRVLALDYGSARCGCALSDPTGTLATPIDAVERPRPARASRASSTSCASAAPSGWSSGCRSGSAAPTPTRRARRARGPTAWPPRCAVPVELYDERFTTAIAARSAGDRTSEDSRAAAVLLEDWLARHAQRGDRLMPLFGRGDDAARAQRRRARGRAPGARAPPRAARGAAAARRDVRGVAERRAASPAEPRRRAARTSRADEPSRPTSRRPGAAADEPPPDEPPPDEPRRPTSRRRATRSRCRTMRPCTTTTTSPEDDDPRWTPFDDERRADDEPEAVDLPPEPVPDAEPPWPEPGPDPEPEPVPGGPAREPVDPQSTQPLEPVGADPRAAHRLAPAPADRGARPPHRLLGPPDRHRRASRAATTRPSPARRGCRRTATSACRRRAGAGCGASSCCCSSSPLAAVAVFAFLLFQPFHGKGYDAVVVKIPPGSSAGDIGDLLAVQGRRRVGLLLRAARAPRRATAASCAPARYTLQRSMPYRDALAALTEAPKAAPTIDVTLPEGPSRRELAPRVKPRPACAAATSRPASARACSRPRNYGAPKATQEPRGLPVPRHLPAAQPHGDGQAARQPAARTRSSASSRKVDLKRARRKHLSRYDVLIIASMIEREAQVPKDRRLISAVIYNRLQRGIPLGIDATLRYRLNNWSKALRESELNIDSELQHAPAHRPAADADRQPGPGLDPGRRRPGQRQVPLLRRQAVRQRRPRLQLDRRAVPEGRRRLQPRPRQARRQGPLALLSDAR